LTGSGNWVIFGNHADDDECAGEPHSFIAMEHDTCYLHGGAGGYITDGSAYAYFATYNDCTQDPITDGAIYEADIEQCIQLIAAGDYYTAVDTDTSSPINEEYPLAWAEYDGEDCQGEDLEFSWIKVIKADDINEIWAQDYESKIISPRPSEKIVHSCESWGEGSYYYWGDEVLERMSIDMVFDWTESEDSASMVASSLLMVLSAFIMIFAWVIDYVWIIVCDK